MSLHRLRRALPLLFLALIVGCSSSTKNEGGQNQLPAPLFLDELHTAGEIEVGEVAIIILQDPMKWRVENNSPRIVELQPATDDGSMQTNVAVTGLELGTANLFAEQDGIGLSFTIEVVLEKGSVLVPLGDSGYQVSLPSFLAERVEVVTEDSEVARDVDALWSGFIYFRTIDGERRYASSIYLVTAAKWKAIQNPNEPPLGDKKLQEGDEVLVVAGPVDLPFNDRYSDDANRYGTLATLLDSEENYSLIR